MDSSCAIKKNEQKTYEAMDKDQGVGVGRGGHAIPIIQTRGRSLLEHFMFRKLLRRVDTFTHGNVGLDIGSFSWDGRSFDKRDGNHGQSHAGNRTSLVENHDDLVFGVEMGRLGLDWGLGTGLGSLADDLVGGELEMLGATKDRMRGGAIGAFYT